MILAWRKKIKKEGRRERPEARKKHAVQRRGSFFLHRERHKEVSLQGGEALRAECLRGQKEQALQGAVRRVSRAAGGQVTLQAAEICATALARGWRRVAKCSSAGDGSHAGSSARSIAEFYAWATPHDKPNLTRVRGLCP